MGSVLAHHVTPVDAGTGHARDHHVRRVVAQFHVATDRLQFGGHFQLASGPDDVPEPIWQSGLAPLDGRLDDHDRAHDHRLRVRTTLLCRGYSPGCGQGMNEANGRSRRR